MAKKKRVRRLVEVAFVLAWAVVLGLYITRNLHSGALRPPSVAVSELPPEEWASIYIEDQKIGYAHSRYEYDGDDIRTKTEMKTVMKFLGTSQTIYARLDALLNQDLSLKKFNATVSASGLSMEISGYVEGNEIVAKLRSKAMGKDQEYRFPIKGPVYLLGEFPQAMRGEKLKVGDKFMVPSFSPDSFSTTDAVYIVERFEKIEILGKSVQSTVITTSVHGMEIIIWVDKDGNALMSEMPAMGMITRKTTKEEALDMPEVGKADLVLKAAVPSNKIISKPWELRSLTLKLSGVELSSYDIKDGRQKLVGDVLIITREKPQSKQAMLPFNEPGLKKLTGPSPFVQSDAPKIVELARKIVGDETDSNAAAVKILHWVYNNVKKQPMASIPSAVDVLETMKGDCNEHATLYAALARAAGIPTQINAGLVYLGGNFYYHAWNSVYIGEWVAVDPVMDQFPADVTHIKFVQGGLEKQIQIIGLMGKLKIEVVKMSK